MRLEAPVSRKIALIVVWRMNQMGVRQEVRPVHEVGVGLQEERWHQPLGDDGDRESTE